MWPSQVNLSDLILTFSGRSSSETIMESAGIQRRCQRWRGRRLYIGDWFPALRSTTWFNLL